MAQLLIGEAACRLLTLIGPGGIGKTRLALKVGRRLLDREQTSFPDGVYFAPLAAVTDQAQVASTLAAAFQGER